MPRIEPLPEEFEPGYSLSRRAPKSVRSIRYHACEHKTPCGRPCCLWAGNHVYHSCYDENCSECHGAQRFMVRRRA